MDKDLQDLYKIYEQVKIKSPVHNSKLKKGDIVKVIYEDNQYPGEWVITALSDSSLNRYNKERVRFYYEGILGDAEWDGEKWFSNTMMCFH